VDLIRPAMEAVANDLDVECHALAQVGDELVYLARAGTSSVEIPTGVGRRLPFMPPVGVTFAAWAGRPAVQAWLSKSMQSTSAEQLAGCHEMVERVRRRGYSVGLGDETHSRLWNVLTRDISESHGGEIWQASTICVPATSRATSSPGRANEVRTISAPVFGPDGRVVIQLTLFGLPDLSSEEIKAYADRLVRGARTATEAAGGQVPPEQPPWPAPRPQLTG